MNRGRANRRAIGLAMLFGVVTSLMSSRSVTLAKEFEMLGTIDCSLASGVTCPIGDSLTLWTTAISGTREPFVIDVSWIRNQIESGPQRQDDLLCLQVEERPGIGYRALSVRDRCEDEAQNENRDEDRNERKEKNNGVPL